MSNQSVFDHTPAAPGFYVLIEEPHEKRRLQLPIIVWRIGSINNSQPISITIYGTHLTENIQILTPNGEVFQYGKVYDS